MASALASQPFDNGEGRKQPTPRGSIQALKAEIDKIPSGLIRCEIRRQSGTDCLYVSAERAEARYQAMITAILTKPEYVGVPMYRPDSDEAPTTPEAGLGRQRPRDSQPT